VQIEVEPDEEQEEVSLTVCPVCGNELIEGLLFTRGVGGVQGLTWCATCGYEGFAEG
jgi:predicted RNA-binding Zn-ribbon protein involved in translation (DUF1610 family)